MSQFILPSNFNAVGNQHKKIIVLLIVFIQHIDRYYSIKEKEELCMA